MEALMCVGIIVIEFDVLFRNLLVLRMTNMDGAEWSED
jgi:hypothetical protein